MKPAAFAYTKARSLTHAIELLNDEPDARILAGGQSLVATLNMRLDSPRLLVDINGLAELATTTHAKSAVEIGALVRQRVAERDADIARLAPLIAKALPHIAHPAIRNRGTVGGSIAYADPAAELPACLVALDAELEIAGRNGHRRVKAESFFTGLFETDIRPGEILTKIVFQAADLDHRFGFAELARRHGDYALVGLAASARVDGAHLKDVRLVYFGVGPTPTRAREAERALSGGAVDLAIAALASDLDPKGDIHASAASRRHLAGVLLERVVPQLRGQQP